MKIDLAKEVPYLDGAAAITGLQEINEEETEAQLSGRDPKNEDSDIIEEDMIP